MSHGWIIHTIIVSAVANILRANKNQRHMHYHVQLKAKYWVRFLYSIIKVINFHKIAYDVNDDPLIFVLLMIIFPLFCFVSFVDCWLANLCHFLCSVIEHYHKVFYFQINKNSLMLRQNPYLVSWYIMIPLCNHKVDTYGVVCPFFNRWQLSQCLYWRQCS